MTQAPQKAPLSGKQDKPAEDTSVGFVFFLCIFFLILYFSPLLVMLWAIFSSHFFQEPVEWVPSMADLLIKRRIDFGIFGQLVGGLSSAGGFAYLRRRRDLQGATLYSRLILIFLIFGTALLLGCYFLFGIKESGIRHDYPELVFKDLMEWCTGSITASVALTSTLLGIRLQESKA